jgi:hypothetical protein
MLVNCQVLAKTECRQYRTISKNNLCAVAGQLVDERGERQYLLDAVGASRTGLNIKVEKMPTCHNY